MAGGVIADDKVYESELTNDSSSSKRTDELSSSVEESPFKKAKFEASDEEEPPKVEHNVCLIEETEDEYEEDEDEDEDEDDEEDDDTEESDSEEDEVDRQYRLYRRHIAKTGGFYVDPDLIPRAPGFGIIRPVDFEDGDEVICKWAKQGTYAAIAKYNTKHKDSPLEFVEIVRANHNKILFYITFEAKEVSSGNIQTYRALVRQFCDSKVLFVRPERKPKKQIQGGDAGAVGK